MKKTSALILVFVATACSLIWVGWIVSRIRSEPTSSIGAHREVSLERDTGKSSERTPLRPDDISTKDESSSETESEKKYHLEPLGLERFPTSAGDLEKVGEFEVLTFNVTDKGSGTFRVERVIRTNLKYPNLWIVEEYSGGSLASPSTQKIAAADHILVQFRAGLEREEIAQAALENGLTVQKWFSRPGMVALKLPSNELNSVSYAIDQLLSDPRVEIAEPDFMVFVR